MREILFRGKRVDNGEWVYGMYIPYQNGEAAILYEKFSAYGYEATELCQRSKVIPETIGQFTGLTDMNGNKIFEGDYIICSRPIESKHFDKLIEMGYVEMKCGAFGLHRKQGYYRSFKDWLEDYEYEIIGNIHDNPELISGGSNAD